MRIGSFGIVFVVMIMLFIIGVGILAMTNTSFELGSYKTSQLTDWN
jgi:cell division protein FtsX